MGRRGSRKVAKSSCRDDVAGLVAEPFGKGTGGEPWKEKASGETPRTYLTRRRIERAKDLLRAANLTITEICFLVGFESVGSFSSRFRDLVGMSPTEYRSASAGAPPIPGCFVLMWTRPGLARSQQSGRSTDDGRAVASGP